MDFGATTTTTVEDLAERKPLTLSEWVVRYRDSVWQLARKQPRAR
jgi:hypothetical protein